MKEREKVLVVGISRVLREKPVRGSIRQLYVSLSKIINLVEDHSGTSLVCQVGLGCYWGEGCGEIGLGDSGQDMGDIEFKGVGGGYFGTFLSTWSDILK